MLSIMLAGLIAFSTLFSPALISSAQAQGLSILRDAEIEEWIVDYSYPIFEAANLEPESIEFLIVGDPTLNAFASGRTMGIFTGLITAADTPNQIEGVIAHEAGHMAGGHGPRRAEAYAQASRPILLSLVLAAAAIAAGAPEAGIGLFGLGQQIGTVNALAYTRGQEASADQAALSYLTKVGHSGEGLIEFFGKLRNSQIITARRANPYLQSHPLANARVTALTDRVTKSEYSNVKDDEAAIKRLRLIQAKIKGFLQDPIYTLRQYPLSDQSDPGKYARAVAFYRDSSIDRALTEINSLLNDYPDNPYFQELKGQMLFEFGRISESIEPHRKSVALKPTKALLKVNLGRALLATGDTQHVREAIEVLNAALALEPDNSFGWYELARAHGTLFEEGPALLATAESRYYGGDKGGALQFARRSLQHFERGTPQWQEAQDIIVAVSNEGNRRNSGARRQQRPDGRRGGGQGGGRGNRPDQGDDETGSKDDQPEKETPDQSDTLPEDGRVPEVDTLP